MSTASEPSMPAPADELQLVARCQVGDTLAFNELVTRYRQRAFAMIYNMVRNEQDAWDLTQDGFLKAWKSIGRFGGKSSFSTWLYRIWLNVKIEWMRRKKTKGGTEFDEGGAFPNGDPAAITAQK